MKFKIMTLNKLILRSALLIGILAFQSCKDEIIQIQGTQESNFTVAKSTGVIIGQDGKSAMSNYDFHQEGKFKFAVQLNKPLNQDATVKLMYDESVLDSYNTNNGTNFAAYPKDLISIANNGDVSITSKNNISNSVEITLKANESATPDDIFALPLKASSNSFEGHNAVEYILFVKDLTKGASAAKENGLKVFSIIEANNVNPLMHLAFNLKSSGKPLFDHVVLFSSNINYNAATGRVYINHNENLTHILENRDKYIKPLQDRGIKVSLSLLGNHDISGIANLSDETIKYFAQEIKKTCEIYGLDGVFYDDEYSAYTWPSPPGFEYPSNQRAAKLMYEVKRIMPTTISMAYVYSRTSSFGESWWGDFNGIEEADAGEYVDYAIHDYGGSYELGSNYPGLPKSGWIMRSSEHALNRYQSLNGLRTIRTNNEGGTMVFSLNPHASNVTRQMTNLNNIATAFYDDELVYDAAKAPRKDW